MSNLYPPSCGYGDHTYLGSCDAVCSNGHVWEAEMEKELGVLCFLHKSQEECPECGEDCTEVST